MDRPSDPRIPAPETCVLRYVFDRHAQERPSACFVRFEDGAEWSYVEIRTRVRRTAAALQAAGVSQGDHVLILSANSGCLRQGRKSGHARLGPRQAVEPSHHA